MFELDLDTERPKDVTYDYSSIESIPVIEASDLTYTSFFNSYMLPNLPCIIKGITSDWQCMNHWFTENQTLNFEYLEENYGMDMVQIYNCQERFYNTQKSYTCCFKDYINNLKEIPDLLLHTSYEYVKNWHLQLHHPEDRFYEFPIYFASDWLNEYYVNCLDDDYRFVYMGSAGTWTPFHADVFTSYSWSVNIFGKKRWIVFPPGTEEMLKNPFGELPYDVESDASTSITDNSTTSSVKTQIEVIQNPGEAIFIPSGWHHQVQNLTYAVSVNHNWVNGCNINFMFESLQKALADVKEEIKDCNEMDDFEDHCQIMLNSHFGMNFEVFYKFLMYIATKRIEMLQEITPRTLFHGHEIGLNHILFDLQSLKHVLEIFLNCDDIKNLDYFVSVDPSPLDLLNKIIDVLEIDTIST